MIKLEHISLAYNDEAPVLRELSCHLEPGSIHFLTGQSGAGKSTLLNLLDLSIRPTSGTLRLFGKAVNYTDTHTLALLRRRIGVIFQDFRLLDHLTVAENIMLPLVIADMKAQERLQRTNEMLEWLGMQSYSDAYPSILSGGEKQQVAIARAIINQPDIILADEPTGNLDTEHGHRLMKLLITLNTLHKTTIIIATHDLPMTQSFSFPILTLKNGKLRAG